MHAPTQVRPSSALAECLEIQREQTTPAPPPGFDYFTIIEDLRTGGNCEDQFGEMTFGEMTFGEMTFGEMTFGEMTFGEMIFIAAGDSKTFHCRSCDSKMFSKTHSV